MKIQTGKIARADDVLIFCDYILERYKAEMDKILAKTRAAAESKFQRSQRGIRKFFNRNKTLEDFVYREIEDNFRYSCLERWSEEAVKLKRTAEYTVQDAEMPLMTILFNFESTFFKWWSERNPGLDLPQVDEGLSS